MSSTSLLLSQLSSELEVCVRNVLQEESSSSTDLYLSLVRALLMANPQQSSSTASAAARQRLTLSVLKIAATAAAAAEEERLLPEDNSQKLPPTTNAADADAVENNLLETLLLPLVNLVVAASTTHPEEEYFLSSSIRPLFLSLLKMYLRSRESSKTVELTLRTLTPLFLKTPGAEESLLNILRDLPPPSPSCTAGVAQLLRDVPGLLLQAGGSGVVDWNSVLLNSCNNSKLSPWWTTVADLVPQQVTPSEELLSQITNALLDNKDTSTQKHALFLLQKIFEHKKSVPAENKKKQSLLRVTLDLDEEDTFSLFLSLYTVLDEKQFHIIAPVLQKVLPRLSKTSSSISYYVIVLVKLMDHDNRALVREGLVRAIALGGLRQLEDVAPEEYLLFLERWVLPCLKHQVGWVLLSSSSSSDSSDDNQTSAKEFFNQIQQLEASIRTVFFSSSNSSSSSLAPAVNSLLNVLTSEGTSQAPAVVFFVVAVVHRLICVPCHPQQQQQPQPGEERVPILQKLQKCVRSCLRTLEPFLLSRVTRMILEVIQVYSSSSAEESDSRTIILDTVASLPAAAFKDPHNEEVLREIAGNMSSSDLLKGNSSLGALRLRCALNGEDALQDILLQWRNSSEDKSSAAVFVADLLRIFGGGTSLMNTIVLLDKKTTLVLDDLEVLLAAIDSSGEDNHYPLTDALRSGLEKNLLLEGVDPELTWRSAMVLTSSSSGSNNICSPGTRERILSLFLGSNSSSSGCHHRQRNSSALFSLQMETLRSLLMPLLLLPIESVEAVLVSCLELLDSLGGTGGTGLVPSLELFIAARTHLSCSETCSDGGGNCSSCSLVRTFGGTAWTLLQEARRTDSFATGLQLFSRLAVKYSKVLLHQYAEEILRMGETVLGAPLTLVTALQEEFLILADKKKVLEDDDPLLTQRQQILLVKLLVCGPPLPKANRAVFAIVHELSTSEQQLDNLPEPPTPTLAPPLTRYMALQLLRNTVAGRRLVPGVVRGLLQVEAEDEGRYFENSWTHRRKQRAVQAILALQPLFSNDDEELSLTVLRSLLMSLSRDSPQPSVRYLSEWTLARILTSSTSNSIFQDEFFSLSKKVWSTRVGFGSLFASIGLQTWKLFLSQSDSSSPSALLFLSRLLPLLCELVLGNHKTVRVYAQVCFERIFHTIPTTAAAIVIKEKFHQFSGALEESKRSLLSGNARKILEATAQDFYIHHFDPHLHFTDNVLFRLLPLLAGAPQDELLPSRNQDHPSIERLYLSSVASAWHLRNIGGGGGSSGHQQLNQQEEESSSTLFQKKLVPPPKTTSSSVDNTAAAATSPLQQSCSSLIVVASLVDRVPNLGGLCRTCEVFGVSEFVVPSLKVLQDSNFTSLAVSAHHWVPITQVHPAGLDAFLHNLATQHGYQVVALEQTDKSTSINHFSFPTKTVLLLGNEKRGIPAPLLNKVDHCVEIPQVGLIRSLNVHVSGAIAIHTFASQHSSGKNKSLSIY